MCHYVQYTHHLVCVHIVLLALLWSTFVAKSLFVFTGRWYLQTFFVLGIFIVTKTEKLESSSSKLYDFRTQLAAILEIYLAPIFQKKLCVHTVDEDDIYKLMSFMFASYFADIGHCVST